MTAPDPATHFQTDDNVPSMELNSRIAALQKHLSHNKVDAALILQSSDLY